MEVEPGSNFESDDEKTIKAEATSIEPFVNQFILLATFYYISINQQCHKIALRIPTLHESCDCIESPPMPTAVYRSFMIPIIEVLLYIDTANPFYP